MGQESRIKTLRALARQRGIAPEKVDNAIALFGLDIAEEVIKQYTPVKELRQALKELKDSKLRATIDVEPAQLEAMAGQVGIDVRGGLWTVLTREHTPERLYELLTRAGATLDATKEKRDRAFWFGEVEHARAAQAAAFWPTE